MLLLPVSESKHVIHTERMRGHEKSHKRMNLDTATSIEQENTFLLSDVNCGMLNRIVSPSLFGVKPRLELTMAFSIAFKLKNIYE